MTTKKNLVLWDRVSKTDPSFTKKAKKGAYQFTSIAPMYQIKKATEAFGVQGIGWGVDPDSELFLEATYGETSLIHYSAKLYFHLEGIRGEIPIHSSIKIAYMTNGQSAYFKIDDDSRKKVATDAKTKGLSELGFSADVFLGQFDDPNYIAERQFEESINSEEKRLEAIEDFTDWCIIEAAAYKKMPNLHALKSGHQKTKNTAIARCRALGLDQEKYLARFDATFQESIDKLKQGEATHERA